ncbi:MAG: hypothetical protein KQH53_05195 [Desulfarculaceae bacterium]|nr:hypothetical protein [Desulfarculaceae bacterium]
MGLWQKIKPAFWDRRESELESLNYRRLWRNTFGLGLLATLLPVILLSWVNFYQFDQQYELQSNQIRGHIQRLLSTGQVQISYFLDERRAALTYVSLGYTFEELSDLKHLGAVFLRLRRAFGGFVDLGLIDQDGIQRAYMGPYNLQGRAYKDQDWYKEVQLRGIYVSDVFLGHRNFPHFVIAVRHEREGEKPYVLRATIDTGRLNNLLRAAELQPSGDLFLVNQQGVLQTPSQLYGGVLARFPLLPSSPQDWHGIVEGKDLSGHPLLMGMARIENTPLTLVLVNQPKVLLHKWGQLRINVIVMIAVSVLAILVVLWWGTSTLVSRVFEADLRRVGLLHEAEYTNKLASIGRLAAGVAHEINNPVAIINEKVGLMSDLLAVSTDFGHKEKFLKLTQAIQGSVKRVSEITHRLLGFARHLPLKYEQIHLQALVKEVLGFLGKEAEYRNIDVKVNIPPEVPTLRADKGQLQQVLLNIINNAMAAMDDGGGLDISVSLPSDETIAIAISDDGVGIPKENLNSIFEPFFSTRGEKGTGLGLSITYGIVQKMGGHIDVHSEPGQGTTFTVVLPR